MHAGQDPTRKHLQTLRLIVIYWGVHIKSTQLSCRCDINTGCICNLVYRHSCVTNPALQSLLCLCNGTGSFATVPLVRLMILMRDH